MRLPKEIYYAHRVIQSETPDLHIIGHWTYPADTKKTMYVISNTKTVELLLNGQSLGKNSTPTDGFNFVFPNVAFQPGSLVAVGYDAASKKVARQELQTAGPAKSIKLTPLTAPGGMRADGEDIALIDFEVVDAQGRRCPTDDTRVDFTCAGPAVWRGGINSGKEGSTNNLYLNTECGINRVAVRSTTSAGKIVVTAKRDGLESAAVEIETKPVAVTDGLAKIDPVYLPLK
jgi:beta-galactosidase